MTTPAPEAIEAAARAMDKNFNPDKYPIMTAMFMDYAETALTAATPIIAAQSLRETADAVEVIDPAWDSALYVDGAYHPLPDWLRNRAATIESEAS